MKGKRHYTEDEPREEGESWRVDLAPSFVKDSSIRRRGPCAQVAPLRVIVKVAGTGACARPALKEINDGLVIVAFCFSEPGRLALGLATSSIFILGGEENVKRV